MINFRFHVVSIIAIFLAIAIGTVMGASFVGRGVVDNLQRRIDEAEKNKNDIRARNSELDGLIGELEKYIEQSAAITVQGRLTGIRVDVVATRGIDEGRVDAQVTLLRAAGATVPGVIWLEDAWQVDTPVQAGALRTATGLTQRSAGPLRTAAATLLGTRVATAPVDVDVLGALADAKFVSLAGAAGSVAPSTADFTGGPGRLVVLGGPQSDVPPKVVESVAAAALAAGQPVGVGELFAVTETVTDRGTWLDSVADTDALRGRVSTVNDCELTQGAVAMTLALAELGTGTVGSYGIGEDRTVPETVPLVPSAR